MRTAVIFLIINTLRKEGLYGGQNAKFYRAVMGLNELMSGGNASWIAETTVEKQEKVVFETVNLDNSEAKVESISSSFFKDNLFKIAVCLKEDVKADLSKTSLNEAEKNEILSGQYFILTEELLNAVGAENLLVPLKRAIHKDEMKISVNYQNKNDSEKNDLIIKSDKFSYLRNVKNLKGDEKLILSPMIDGVDDLDYPEINGRYQLD